MSDWENTLSRVKAWTVARCEDGRPPEEKEDELDSGIHLLFTRAHTAKH